MATTRPQVAVRTAGLHTHEGGPVMLSGERLRLRLTVRRAEPGSVLVIRATHAGRQILLQRRVVATYAVVRTSLHAGPGLLTVRIRLTRGDGRAAVRKRPLQVGIIQPTASAGARGLRVRFLQRRLARLRYAVAITSRYDDATRRAVIAFRKVNLMTRVGSASRAVFARAARMRGGFRPRRRGPAHVEGDLTRQVLALVNWSTAAGGSTRST
jgi:hypothetical protein